MQTQIKTITIGLKELVDFEDSINIETEVDFLGLIKLLIESKEKMIIEVKKITHERCKYEVSYQIPHS